MKVFSIVPVVIFLFGLALSSDATARPIGIYLCDDCILASPNPDEHTSNMILHHQGNWNNSHPKDPVAMGDVIVLCNGSICVQYAMLADGSYMGGTPINQSPPSGGGGGAGGHTPPGSGNLVGTLVCGYVNGELDHCQMVYQYVA